MTENNDAVSRALELVMFGPIGLASYLKEVTPSAIEMLVARGRAEVDRGQEQVQQRVTTARSLGQVAMAFGVPMVRQRRPNSRRDPPPSHGGDKAAGGSSGSGGRSGADRGAGVVRTSSLEQRRQRRRGRRDSRRNNAAERRAPHTGLRRVVGVAGRGAAHRVVDR